ncbi:MULTISPECIES: transaldolase [unclassified Nitratiruptor]|uniref:transaldolase n=1 Tax=unclassified Nitratiruptor TaxID=2624044 RepID=UPI0019154246|nr:MULTISPECIES: transaldolase [unclassified Nitratiruptor]BCD59719.1 transaldolase [Nitratiruptor sp. YY08-10]BCD63643.1 transaldolase [Nitratiruptor sp. YY08-14]
MYNNEIHFSLWLDFLEREFIQNEFQKVISQYKITGATSNPAIFKEAILNSSAYQAQLHLLQNKNPKEKYEALAIKDIQMAADVLKPLYDKGDDGFVSIEVDPRLAHDAQGTVQEAKRLFQEIGKENVMIKIPVTPAGCEAIEELVADGIHINATLIFSPYQARECLDAMERGSKKNQNAHKVLSIFVSRFDRKLDPILQSKGLPIGKVGIMNAAKIYNMIKKRDLPYTRALFASTGVKGGAYPAHYYISSLVAPNSVNTAPLSTIEAFVKDGDERPKLPISEEEIDHFFAMLKAHEIDMKQVYHDLLHEGLKAFEEAFEAILQELD